LNAARGNFGLIWAQGKGENHPSYADWTLQSVKKWPEFNNELSPVIVRSDEEENFLGIVMPLKI
jgi:hypothetical protein